MRFCSRAMAAILLCGAMVRAGQATTVPLVAALRELAPPTVEATADVAGYASAGDGGGGQFKWEAASVAEDDGGTILRPKNAPARGAWVRVRANPFIDVREYGCRADYEKIRGDLAANGTLVGRAAAGAARPFSQQDVGKIVVIAAARSWPDYSLDAVPLNARITSVNAQGVATVANLDDAKHGALVASRDAAIECFTDNTDAIARALEWQSAHGLSHVQLPAGGIVGLCPFASQTWAKRPSLNNDLNVKAVFILHDKAVLKGAGRDQSRLKIGYFGEFEPFKREGVVPFYHSCLLFLLEPVENRRTTCAVESFSVEFPHSPVVMSGYSLAADAWNTSPARNAIHATFRDVAVIDHDRNTQMVYSINGGIYDADNHPLDESIFHFENCDFETGGGFSFKNQNTLRPDQKGGKAVYLTNVTIRGGGNIVTRHVLDAASFEREGDAYYLRVDQPRFSWKDFNAHSNQVVGAFNPTCLVRKAYSGTIEKVSVGTDDLYSIQIASPAGSAPVSKSGATVLIAFGGGDKQIYVEQAATLKQGSNLVTCRLSGIGITPESATKLVGETIRIYYEENQVKTLYEFTNARRIRVDPQTATGQSLLGQRGLDVTVNYEGARGAFGHSFYVAHNVSFFLDHVTIRDSAKRSFRVSKGGSEAMQGDHELIDYQVPPSRGMAAMANQRTVHQAMEEFGGRLKLRRSKAISVYGVELDMDDHSTFESQGGVLGGSVIRNSTLRGWVAGTPTPKPTLIENSEVDINLLRQDDIGERMNRDGVDDRTPRVTLKNCTGSVAIQNGVLTAEACQLRLGFGAAGEKYAGWKGGIAGTLTECTVSDYAFNLHELAADAQQDFAGRFQLIRCGGKPLLKPQ